MSDGTLYSVVRNAGGTKFHVVSRWSAPNGLPRTVCGRVFSRFVLTKNGRRLYGRELGTVDLCGNCNRMKDAETA